MAFPQTPLDIRTELLIEDQWVDVSGDVYNRDPVQITYGRPDEAEAADPLSATFTLNNREGKYSPRNPRSPYYGKIGRNTPVRISVAGGEPYLSVDGSMDSVVTTPYDPVMDLAGNDLDVRIEATVDWFRSGSQSLIGQWGVDDDQRSWWLRVNDGGLLTLNVTTDGTKESGYFWAWRLPTTLPRRAAVRCVLEADTTTVRFFWAYSLDGPWYPIKEPINIGAVVPFVSSAPLRLAPGDLTYPTPRPPMVGDIHRAEVRIGDTLVAAPDFRQVSAGTSGFTDAAGRVWSVDGTAQVSDRYVRFEGEVSSWPANWTPNGGDSWVSVQASGLTRRLGQGKKPLTSVLTRRITSYKPVAYWPFEEDEGASRAFSPISGVRYADAVSFDFGGDAPGGSAPLPVLKPGAHLDAPVPLYEGANWWAVQWVMFIPDVPQSTVPLIRVASSGTVTRHYLYVRPQGLLLRGFGPVSTENGETLQELYNYESPSSGQSYADLFGQWIRMRFRAILPTSPSDPPRVEIQWLPIGGSVTYTAWANYSTPRSSWRAGAVSRIYNDYPAEAEGIGFGHLSVLTTEAQYAAYDFADHGYTGEAGNARLERVAREAGVALQVDAPEGMVSMGPQRPKTFLETLDEIALADGGILADSLSGRSLLYRSPQTIYNQSPRLALDFSQVAPPLLPVDDDQFLVNDATVSREGGGRARAVLESGRMSVEEPPVGAGRYDTELTVNTADDSALQPRADWMVHTGTWEESRYPVLNLNLALHPELIRDVLRLRLLDRVVVSNPPDWLPPDPIDLVVQGWTERLSLTTWDLELNATPYGPWDVGKLAGREISEGFEAQAFALDISFGGAAPWARSMTSPHSGSYCLQSGTISHNQTSDCVVAIPPNAVTLSAWYRSSSEQGQGGFLGDRLTILVDDQEVRWVSGITDWAPITLDVRDASTVTFRYSKDNSVGAGTDAAYIDDLVLTVVDGGDEDYRADTDGSILHLPVDEESTRFHVTTTDGPLWARGGLPLNANPDFATDLSGWAGYGATIERVPAEDAPFSGWAMRMIPDGVAQYPNAGSEQIPIAPGLRYVVSGWLRCDTARAVDLNVNWFDVGHNYADTSSYSKPVDAGEWTWFESVVTAPAGAAFANLAPTVSDFPPPEDALTVAHVGLRAFTPGADPTQFPIPVTIGGEPMLATAIEDSVVDTFTRTVADGWGLASSGDPWVRSSGAAAEYAVDGSAGTIRLDPALGGAQTQLRGQELLFEYGDSEVVASFSTDTVPVGGSQVIGVFTMGVNEGGTPSFFWTNLVFNSNGTIGLLLRDTVTPVGATVPTGLTYSPGTKVWLRSWTVGNRVRARAWLDGMAEPRDWPLDRTVDGAVQSSGSVGVMAAATELTSVPTFRVDDFRMVNPQVFTVTRPGPVLAHPAGAQVNVTHPLRVAW